jgi:hypothetical protein
MANELSVRKLFLKKSLTTATAYDRTNKLNSAEASSNEHVLTDTSHGSATFIITQAEGAAGPELLSA